MFLWLIQCGIIITVHLEFMVPGHSYMPCDRKFGELERKFQKKENIYTPEEYRELINGATNSSSVEMDHDKLLDFKNLLNFVQHRKAKAVKFSKARRIILTSHDPWAMYLYTPDGQERVNLEKTNNKLTLPEHVDLKVQHKYVAGKHIKINESKLAHLQSLRLYMTQPGRRWLDMVEVGQTNAVARPRTADNDNGDPEENTQGNIIADQYEDPQYEPEAENEEPPLTANPRRGIKRKKDTDKVAKLPKNKK